MADEFFVGGGLSDLAIDGPSPRSDWYRWAERRGVDTAALPEPAPIDAFAHDLTLLAEHGVRHLRITVDWARLEPRAGLVDDEEIERLLERFTLVADRGLHAWVTLHHTTLPGWFADDTDGFLRTAGPSLHWSRHVDRVAEILDGLVAGWIPNEDPLGWALRSHQLDTRPGRPGEQNLRDAAEGVLEATFEACRLLSSGRAPVVASFGIPPVTGSHEAAADHVEHWTEVLWSSWTEAIRDGVLRWPWRAPRERPDLADSFDAIGVALAPELRVGPDGDIDAAAPPSGEHFGSALRRAADLLPGRELVVTSLGHDGSDANEQDDLLGGWLDQIHDARNDGLAIRGAFLEPLFDGPDPGARTRARPGVFSAGRDPKPAARWLLARA